MSAGCERLVRAWRAIDFARLNHVLIPSTKARRDRLRESRLGRAGRPLVRLYESLSAEGSVFVGVAVLAGALGLDVHGGQTYALWGCLTALLLGSLGCTGLYRLRAVSLQVRVPRRVIVGEEAVFRVQLRSRAAREHQVIRVRGPFLPWDGRWSRSQGSLRALPAGGRAEGGGRARFAQRGEHHLDPFRAAALVPLGLALGPSIYSGGSRFVVVPRPARVVSLSALERGAARAEGASSSLRRGASPELLGVRPYRPGDRARDLHARSWARRGVPLVREYPEERSPQLCLWLEPGSERAGSRALEAAVSLSAGIALHALHAGARVDLAAPGCALAPLRGLCGSGDGGAVLDWLAQIEPGPAPEPAALVRLATELERGSAWVWVSARGLGPQSTVLTRARARGILATAVQLTPENRGEPGVRVLHPDAVLRGEAIAL